MDNSLRNKTITGSFWTIIERFGYLTLQFVSNIVLARLLLPEDFGTIGILLVFVTISEVLVDGGFSTALIQRKKINNEDISTVFYTNLAISIFIYLVIFILSPSIAQYFKNQGLSFLLRIIEIKIIIDAFGAVQFALLKREMDFKSITKIRIISIFVAVAIAIIAALLGFGVWALIIQNISFSLLSVSLAWLYSSWRPHLIFSMLSLSNLFGYGSKLMLQQLLSEIYENFQSVLIGRHFLAKDLGYFTQAKQLQQVPVKSLSSIVTSVSFPAFSKLQDDKQSLKRVVKKNLNVLLFVNTPVMFYLAVLAEPIILFLYSAKWLPSVRYFQLLCLGFGVFLVIHQCNLSVLKAVGRSDYVLYLEIVKKLIGFCLLILGMNIWGIWGILYGLLLNSFIELFLNGYFVNKEIRYGVFEQFHDLFITILYSLIPSFVVYAILRMNFIHDNILVICVCTLVYWGVYYLVTKAFKCQSLFEIEIIIKEFVINKQKKIDGKN